ncbi:MAG: MFS transporter [Methanolinea sp.]|nr:MFS transporter [Methanolinea sp.]
MSRREDHGKDTAERRAILLIAVLTSFLTPFMISSVNIAIPDIGSEFGADAVLLGWIPTSYILASAIILIPVGRLADIHGMRRVFFPGIVIFTLSSLLCALSSSTPMLIGLRVLQGIGNAMVYSTAVAALTAVYPPGKRGMVLGLSVAATYTGLSLGPVLGGILTWNFGWRSTFLAVIPVSVAIILLLLKNGHEWTEPFPERFDLAGSILYGFSLLCLIYGLSLLPETPGFAITALCIPLGAAFVLWERRTESPIIRIDLFLSNRVFSFSSIATMINYSATFATSFLLALYLQYVRGLDPQTAGIILAAQPVVQAAFSPAAGRLSDRVEPGVIASAGMGVTVVGLALLSLLSEETPIPFLVSALVVLGVGFALFSSPNTNAVMSSVGREFLGIASATVATARQVGMMLSLGITMVIFAVVIGRVQVTPDVHAQLLASIKVAFTLFAVLCAAGIYFSLSRGNVREGGKSG